MYAASDVPNRNFLKILIFNECSLVRVMVRVRPRVRVRPGVAAAAVQGLQLLQLQIQGPYKLAFFHLHHDILDML